MLKKIDGFLDFLDKKKLWIIGIIIVSLPFFIYILMGKESVFEIHDQLDETILSYLLSAKYIFSRNDVYPEMMNGINSSGMLPAAVLFVPLYKIFDLFTAFVLQYYIITISGFAGMYGLLKKLIESSGVAMIISIIFVLLPFKPVYGLSVIGVPLLILCFWNLYERKKIILSLVGIVYFGLTTHLVLIGYVVLSYVAVMIVVLLIKKRKFVKKDTYFYLGFIMLVISYVIVNHDLFLDLLFKSTDFVSHRVEFYTFTEENNVWRNIFNILVYGEGIYAPSFHWYIAPVAMLITIIEGIRYKKIKDENKKLYKVLLGIWILIFINAFLYGFFTSTFVTEWKNEQNGILHYFQFDRFVWVYPTLWWCLSGISIGLFWKDVLIPSRLVKIIIILAMLLPTIYILKKELIVYDNINQYNNGSQVTGMPTWEEYFMEDVLQLVDEYIGREKETYRVAHLGLKPTPSLAYGFYTIDGYSNNYSLEYKHEFRRIIAKELDKNETYKIYFDNWGSRCYLFTDSPANLTKLSEYKFENIEFDYSQMKAMGCDYILSAKEIESNTEGLRFEGVFSTEDSIYEIWLYYIE